jgi:hypothetical protein
VQIKTSFGTLSFAAREVVSVEDVTSPQQEYKALLEKIDPKDAEARYALAEWALQRNYLEIAKGELQEALKLKPGTDKYRWLLKDVEARLKKTEPAVPAEVKTPATAETATAGKAELLGEEDIYHVRLEELREDDVVSIEFRNRVIDRFVAQMRGKADFRRPNFADEFMAFPPVKKAVYMLRQVAPDDAPIKDDIVVKSDPNFVVNFRARVWPVVSQACASASCHGGGDKPRGGLRLFPGSGPRTDYTNFVILDGWLSGGRRVINRNSPERSLLLQYALPAEQAKVHHPGDIPAFAESRQAPTYLMIAEWIESLAGPPHPDYRLKWTAPFGMKLDTSGQTSWVLTSEPGAATGPAQ